jgi:hypothetical protein
MAAVTRAVRVGSVPNGFATVGGSPIWRFRRSVSARMGHTFSGGAGRS